jgi:hypothetical protein
MCNRNRILKVAESTGRVFISEKYSYTHTNIDSYILYIAIHYSL